MEDERFSKRGKIEYWNRVLLESVFSFFSICQENIQEFSKPALKTLSDMINIRNKFDSDHKYILGSTAAEWSHQLGVVGICIKTCKTKSQNIQVTSAVGFLFVTLVAVRIYNHTVSFFKGWRWSRVWCLTPERATDAQPDATRQPRFAWVGPNREGNY